MNKLDIVHEFEIKTGIDQVYNALSTAKGINGWWSKDCVYPSQLGENLVVRFNEHSVEMQFRIDALNENKNVKWECVACPNPSFPGTKVEFDVEEVANGTMLKFNHHGWDEKWRGQLNYEQSVQTWGHFMNSLKSYLETGTGMPW